MEREDWIWALGIVREAAEAADAWVNTSGYSKDEKSRHRREFSKRLGSALSVLDRLAPDRARTIRGIQDGQYIVDNLWIAVEQLELKQEIEERLGPSGPRIAASEFHPTVWGAVLSLWDSGHRLQSVLAAAQAVNAQLQEKLDRRDISERDLVAQAFSLDSPGRDTPRLRFVSPPRDEDPKTWTNRHDGARFLGMGLFAGIRNVLGHGDPADEPDPQTTLEYLASFSVLSRWVEEAVVRYEEEAD